MALNKATATTTNETALTAQDVTDIKTALEVLSNLQEVIDGGNTYGNVNQTFTFNENNITFRDTLADIVFTLNGSGIVFTDGSGASIASFNKIALSLKASNANLLASIFAPTLTGGRSYSLPDKSITFAGLDDIPNVESLKSLINVLAKYANIEQTSSIQETVLQANYGEFIDIDFPLIANTSYTIESLQVDFGSSQSFYGKNDDGTYDLLLDFQKLEIQGLVTPTKTYDQCAVFVDDTVTLPEVPYTISSFNEINDIKERLEINSTNLAGNPLADTRIFNGNLSTNSAYKTYLWVYVGGLETVYINQNSIGATQFWAYSEKGNNFRTGSLTPTALPSNKDGYYGKLTIPSNVKYLNYSVTTFDDGHLYAQPLDQKIPYGVNLNNLINDKARKLLIPFWGDSLTAGSGSSIIPPGAEPTLLGTTTYERVRDLIDSDIYETKENGVGGENALEISARIGANPYMLDAETVLPADTTPVAVTFLSSYDPLATVNVDLDNPSDEINPVIIQGIECEITEDGGGNNFINRVTASSSSDTLVENAFVIPRDSYSYLNPYCAVFWMGTNGVTTDFARFYRNIINYVNPNNFIVVGLFKNAIANPGAAEDAEMIKEFGGNYVELRNYLCQQGINDAIKKGYLPDDGTYPTAADVTDIAAGEVPNSLRADDVHLNAVGQVLVGDAIYKRMIDLGIFYNK